MLERIIRSPLSMMFSYFILGGLIWSHNYSPEEFRPYAAIVSIGTLSVVVLFYLLVYVHNKKNPSRKISFALWIPYEFKEEDEGKQWVTFQACRKVYMFYSFAVPFAIIILTIFNPSPGMLLVMLFVMGMSQYAIYWWEERKYIKDDSEEIE
ncbi:hypothetical protein [Sutcliffiella halmapala]|uniref:hypothetical protein n=1 Tax=Sutcliffiella halmapala TaxID=79882 RepID=UPI0009956EDE|nr:hypothetical protein [Sutcliffiella halmapala]